MLRRCAFTLQQRLHPLKDAKWFYRRMRELKGHEFNYER